MYTWSTTLRSISHCIIVTSHDLKYQNKFRIVEISEKSRWLKYVKFIHNHPDRTHAYIYIYLYTWSVFIRSIIYPFTIPAKQIGCETPFPHLHRFLRKVKPKPKPRGHSMWGFETGLGKMPMVFIKI